MRVTIQYYDEDPTAKIAEVGKSAEETGLIVETVRSDYQTIHVADQHAAKALMAKLSPIANIQLQTAA